DEAAQLLQRLVHHQTQRGELVARALRVDGEEAFADLRLQDDVRHRLSRAVVHLARNARALLFLRVDDGLEQTALIHRRRVFGGRLRRGALLFELPLRALDERADLLAALAPR